MKLTATGFFLWLGIIAVTYGCFRWSITFGWIVIGFWCFVVAIGISFNQYQEREKQKKAKFHESNQ